MTKAPFLPAMYAPDSPEEINRAQRECRPEPKAQTTTLHYESEQEVIAAYGLTDGQFYALPESAKTALYAALGINDSVIKAAPQLLSRLIKVTAILEAEGDAQWRKVIEINRAAIAKATNA